MCMTFNMNHMPLYNTYILSISSILTKQYSTVTCNEARRQALILCYHKLSNPKIILFCHIKNVIVKFFFIYCNIFKGSLNFNQHKL